MDYQKTLEVTEEQFNKAWIKRDLMTDGKTPSRDRTNETYLYVSPAHKAKLKAYVDKTKRTMRAEAELWIDSLKV